MLTKTDLMNQENDRVAAKLLNGTVKAMRHANLNTKVAESACAKLQGGRYKQWTPDEQDFIGQWLNSIGA